MKGRFWRKALAAALALLIVSGSMPIQPLSQVFEDIAITASAEDIEGTTVTSNTTTMTTGSYIVDSDVTIDDRITINGDVTLYLSEGTTLTANHGIAVHEGNSLTIDGEGNLTANSNTYSEAAIGGSYDSPNAGTITISGGTINASNNSKGVSAAIGGGYSWYGGNGTIIINGGTITTNIIQGGAASIGGSKGANGGHITIAGGFITANRSGAVTGAGIGGGEKGNAGTIIISGGTVTVPASSSARGAGIGGGEKSDGEGSITINDGNITAVGGAIGGSAGIGGGSNSSAGTITITGGVVNATGGYESAGIGGARGVNGSGGTIAISGGQVTARGSDGAYGIGPSKDGAEGTISMSWTDNTDFIDASYAGTITILKGKRFFYDETEMFAKAEGLYKQEKKIIPAVLDNSLLSSGEILMQRNFVTTEGTAVDVSYDVYDYNGDKLTDGTDYTAVIKNSNDQIVTTFDQLGDYTLTVTGMGNYSGSNSYTFSLVEWDMALMQDGSEHYVNLPENGTKTVYLNVGQSIKVYDSEGKDGKLVASDGRLLLHVPTGYALVVSGKTDAMTWNEAQHDTTNFLSAYENENFTDEITSLFGNSNNISFASAGNSMLIRLNAHNIYRYADQYGLELTISVQKSLTHSDITIATIPDQTYSGSEICPAVIVNDGETKLTLGTDYTVEYSDNVSAGTAKITITGVGDYTGSILKTFEILRAEPTMVKAPTAVENLVFNGNEQELVTAGSTDFGTVLYSLDGTNYSEKVPKGTNAGKYTVYYKVDTDNYYYAPQKVEVTIAESYTITWKNGDEILETDNYVPDGETPEYNGETPTKTADAMYTYSFAGWSPEISDVTGNVTYTAQFSSTAKSYTITYKVDGEIYKTESVSYGNSITLSDAPTKEGYTFSGWQSDYTTMPAQNIEITGTFAINQYAVTYMVDGVQYGESLTVDHGTKLTAPEAPTKNGAIFLGWTADGVNTYDFETPVTAETTLTAMWLDASGFITFSEGYAVTDDTYNGTDRDYVGFRFDVNMDNSNYTVVQHGILYGMNVAAFGNGQADANLRFTDEEATALMDKVREFAAQNTDTETTDWIEVYIGDRRDGVVYARGFIIVTDGTNKYLIYSDVKDGSYNSFSE